MPFLCDLRAGFYDALTLLGIFLGRRPLCGPRILQLNISDECNLDCIMCNRSCFQPSGFLDFDKILSVIGQVYPLGLREVYYHGFGEPFLHPRIHDVFRAVHKTHPCLKQFVITNATCLGEKTIKSILAYRVGLRCSVHAADKTTWARIHPHDDVSSFDRMARAVRRLAAAGPDRISVLFVLFKTNHQTIDSMVKFALEAGVVHVLFRPITFYKDKNGNCMNDHLALSREEHDRVVEKLTAYQKELKDKLKIDMTPFRLSRYDNSRKRSNSFDYYRRKNSCLISWVLSVITKDGDILPGCVEEAFPRMAGNVFKDRFRDVWWSRTLQEFRKKQLFKDLSGMSPSDCLGWCQHLITNRKLNNYRKLRLFSRP